MYPASRPIRAIANAGTRRMCLTALLTWFRDGTAAGAVELSATSDGVELYESLGFQQRRYPTMRLGLTASNETFV